MEGAAVFQTSQLQRGSIPSQALAAVFHCDASNLNASTICPYKKTQLPPPPPAGTASVTTVTKARCSSTTTVSMRMESTERAKGRRDAKMFTCSPRSAQDPPLSSLSPAWERLGTWASISQWKMIPCQAIKLFYLLVYAQTSALSSTFI